MTDTGHNIDCVCGYCLEARKAATGPPEPPLNLDAMFHVFDKSPGAATLLAVALQVNDAAEKEPDAGFVRIYVAPGFAKLLRQAARAMYQKAMQR